MADLSSAPSAAAAAAAPLRTELRKPSLSTVAPQRSSTTSVMSRESATSSHSFPEVAKKVPPLQRPTEPIPSSTTASSAPSRNKNTSPQRRRPLLPKILSGRSLRSNNSNNTGSSSNVDYNAAEETSTTVAAAAAAAAAPISLFPFKNNNNKNKNSRAAPKDVGGEGGGYSSDGENSAESMQSLMRAARNSSSTATELFSTLLVVPQDLIEQKLLLEKSKQVKRPSLFSNTSSLASTTTTMTMTRMGAPSFKRTASFKRRQEAALAKQQQQAPKNSSTSSHLFAQQYLTSPGSNKSKEKLAVNDLSSASSGLSLSSFALSSSKHQQSHVDLFFEESEKEDSPDEDESGSATSTARDVDVVKEQSGDELLAAMNQRYSQDTLVGMLESKLANSNSPTAAKALPQQTQPQRRQPSPVKKRASAFPQGKLSCPYEVDSVHSREGLSNNKNTSLLCSGNSPLSGGSAASGGGTTRPKVQPFRSGSSSSSSSNANNKSVNLTPGGGLHVPPAKPLVVHHPQSLLQKNSTEMSAPRRGGTDGSQSTVSTAPSTLYTPESSWHEFSPTSLPPAPLLTAIDRSLGAGGGGGNNNNNNTQKTSSLPASPIKPKVDLDNSPGGSGSLLENNTVATKDVKKKKKKQQRKPPPQPRSLGERTVQFARDGIYAPQTKQGQPGVLITLIWFEKYDFDDPQEKGEKPASTDPANMNGSSLLVATLEQKHQSCKKSEANRRNLLLDEYSVGGSVLEGEGMGGGNDEDEDDSSDDSSSVDPTMEFLERHLEETTWAECRLALTRLYFAHDKDPEERTQICEATMEQLHLLYDFFVKHDQLAGRLADGQQQRDEAATTCYHSRSYGDNVKRMHHSEQEHQEEGEEHTLRGLESNLCPQVIETLRVRHIENVLSVNAREMKKVRAASLQTSRPFRFVAWQMAKYDTHVALKSVLQKWIPSSAINGSSSSSP